MRKRKIQLDLLKATRELSPLNRDPDFREYREKHLDLILTVLISAAIFFVVGWQLLDYLTGRPDQALVFSIRVAAAASLILFYSVYLIISGKFPVRYFIYITFYLGAFFTPFISYYTGGFESPYWIELVFILIAWFMLIPFSYKKLAVHAFIFIFIYSVILLWLMSTSVPWLILLQYFFIFSAVYLMGLIIAVFNNLFSATVFRSERQIKTSEEKFRMFTQNSLDVVWTIEMRDRTFTYVSPSVFNLLGYRPEEWLGKSIFESLTPESRIEVEILISRAIEEFNDGKRENVTIGEMEQYTKSGETVWVEVIATFLTDREGMITEMMGDSRNITRRKKAETELLKIQERLKQESRELQQENLRIQYESLKSQVNPHFLFNSLNVLTSLIKVDPDLAEKFAEQMAKAYRYVLEHREEDLVSLKTEIDFISSYVFLLEIRFTDKIMVKLDIPENCLDLTIPPLTLQLLIENAVKHNIFSKRTPLIIDIYIDGSRYINVVNNLNKREIKLGSTGVGLFNIAARFSQLTDKKPFFGESDDRYLAKIPLLEDKS